MDNGFSGKRGFFQLGCFYFAKHLLSYILLTYKLFWVFFLKKYFQLLDLRFEIGLSDIGIDVLVTRLREMEDIDSKVKW